MKLNANTVHTRTLHTTKYIFLSFYHALQIKGKPNAMYTEFFRLYEIPKVSFHKEFSDYRKLRLCVGIVVNMKFSIQQTLDSYQYNMGLAIKIFETTFC